MASVLKPYYEHAGITIYHGDCREIMPTFGDASIDLVLCDPPYGHNNNNGDLIHRRRAPSQTMAKKRTSLSSFFSRTGAGC